MHIMKKISLALTALVAMLVPGVASAKAMGTDIVVKTLKDDEIITSFIPNMDYWYWYVLAMLGIYCFFAFFPKRIAGKELPISIGLAHFGRVLLVLVAIYIFKRLIWFVYGQVKGFVLGAVSGTISFLPDFMIDAIVWAISFCVNILVLIALVKMLTSIGTYQSVWGALKALWAKLAPSEKTQKFLAIGGVAFVHICLALIASKGTIWPIITVPILGVLVTVYHFAFEQKVKDAIAIRKTGLTEDGKILCRSTSMVLDKNGKQVLRKCNTKNEPGDRFCRECTDPLDIGATWDCEKAANGCGKQNISFDAKYCPQCRTKRPQLERTSLAPEDVKKLKKDKKLAKKGMRICPHCGEENPAEFNFCEHCDKDMRITPRGASLIPPTPKTLKAATPKQAPSPAPAQRPASTSTKLRTGKKPGGELMR